MEEKKYRVWYVVNPPGRPTYVGVSSPEEGNQFIQEESLRQLRNPLITDNAFGLEVLEDLEDGEWTEWYNDDGEDIFEAFGML